MCIPAAFTFHYASTLSRLNSATGSASSFTFHYASTLSAFNASEAEKNRQIYIPLCFYFIRLSGIIQGQFNFIYIPLCFYFILPGYILARLPCANLHSTMLLLYPNNHHMYAQVLLIYIPLCFYFIFLSNPTLFDILLIYIPLCFYFIQSFRVSSYASSANLHSTMLLLYPVFRQ